MFARSMVSSTLGHHRLCMLWTVKKKKSANAIILEGGNNLVMQFVPIISVPEDPCESDGVKQRQDAVCLVELKQAATILHITFSSNDSEPSPARCKADALRTYCKNIVDDVLAWLKNKHTMMSWESHHGWPQYDRLAAQEYKTWKESAKPRSLATTFPNLIKAYQELKGCSEDKAKEQAKIDAVWIDTSDEELSCPPENSNDEALITEWADFCPTLDPALEHFIEKVDKQHRMTAMQANAVPLHGDGKDDGVQCLCVDTDHPCLNQPNDADVVNTLDDLTDTQVLYGHGSYAGLTFSQFTETPPPPPYGLQALKAIDSLTSSYKDSVVEDHWAFIEDDVSSAALGLCSLSQIPDINMPDDLEHKCGTLTNHSPVPAISAIVNLNVNILYV
ncbi:unnamed protein product [Calypogeia fissa]